MLWLLMSCIIIIETKRKFALKDLKPVISVLSAPVPAESRDSGIETGEQDSGRGVVTEPETVAEPETVTEPELVSGVDGVECSICPRSDSVMFQLKGEILSGGIHSSPVPELPSMRPVYQ